MFSNLFMTEIFTVMKWPLIACLLLPGILVYLGLHIVRREVIFVDLALAQVAPLSACVTLLLGYEAGDAQTYLWSVGFTLIGAAIFAVTRMRNHARVPQEALIGITYVVAAAAGILLLSRTAEGNEELRRTLIGDVLLVSPTQVLKTFFIYLVIGAVHFMFRKKFMMISFEPERAEAEGMAVRWWDFLFYALRAAGVFVSHRAGGLREPAGQPRGDAARLGLGHRDRLRRAGLVCRLPLRFADGCGHHLRAGCGAAAVRTGGSLLEKENS